MPGIARALMKATTSIAFPSSAPPQSFQFQAFLPRKSLAQASSSSINRSVSSSSPCSSSRDFASPLLSTTRRCSQIAAAQGQHLDVGDGASSKEESSESSESSGQQIQRSGKAGAAIERRRRAAAPLPDLLTVKGIGPRNMEKLVAKGIGKLVELKQLYRDKFRTGGTEKLVEYLVASVGVHKNHANVIASFIKDAVDKELESSGQASQAKKRLTFCVEGNISVGKTTFLQRIANETFELRDLVEVVPEPIGKWQDVGKEHFNVLDAFYAEPSRYAYTFQNYVFVTRLMQERESANGLKPLRLMERSVFSDRMVFVRAVHEAKWMSEMEISIYDSWFDPVVAELPGLVPDGFIYLRASPDACLRRLQMRKRPEEQKVTLDYLKGLHEKHEQWLFPTTPSPNSVMSVKEWLPTLHQPPPRIKDRVFYLKGDHVHSSIREVPALILDCEASIDFSKDVEAKAEYARQVADFFEYVKQTRNVEAGVRDNLLLSAGRPILGPDGLVLRP
ncbi:uncharacterized protein LOC9631521 [Selaginella moellendorffii]|nr:uncharacterized protein LOC9631521 [Selaginella moellendorffii]|eukprot:XP_002990474.2 uncharacterized protein LOC9631521 [Selaginella moellendorffii]